MISNEDKPWSTLINYHPTIATIYGASKTHKNNIPLRPIVSGINTVPYNIAKIFTEILTPLLGTINPSHLKKLWRPAQQNKKHKHGKQTDSKS